MNGITSHDLWCKHFGGTMDLTKTMVDICEEVHATCLTTNIKNPKYTLMRYQLVKPGVSFRVLTSPLSLVVTRGKMTLKVFNHKKQKEEAIKVEANEGFHFPQGTSFCISSASEDHEILGGSPYCEKQVEKIENIKNASSVKPVPLSTYRVDKPWGWERWYTQNLDGFSIYSLKLIHMDRGHRSSLQSHEVKSETNYIIRGKAQVLYGLQAPPASESTKQVIDTAKLKSRICAIGDGWSNKVMELHRVVAYETYDAVEISTPELDDVIRWQDDTGRKHGRIDVEHRQSPA